MRNIKFFGAVMILIVTFGISVFSATVTIPAANTNTESNRKPFGSFFGYERTAAIYTEAEHGITQGSAVTDVCWYVNSVNAPNNAPVVIYMAATTSTQFSPSTFASEIAGATRVFSGTITGNSLVADSFRCVPLTTPFPFTSGNLKIMVESNSLLTGNESSIAKRFRWSAGASQSWEADNFEPAGNGVVSLTRPNIRLMFNPPSGPGAIQFRSSSFSADEGTSAIITVDRVGESNAAVSVNYATSDGTATTTDYTSVSGTLVWSAGDITPKTFTIPLTDDSIADPNETVILNLSNPNGTTISGINPATLTIREGFRGTFTVGVGGNFTSLTNSGGIFQAINNTPNVGPLVINIISDLTNESGQNALNPILGNPPVLIKPFGSPRTISGFPTFSLLTINGADNVTIDGSTRAGGNESGFMARELTVTTASPITNLILARTLFDNPSSNNTFKNLIIKGGEPVRAGVGIRIEGRDNDNTRIENCQFQRLTIGVFSVGESIANPNLGTVITRNDFASTGSNSIGTEINDLNELTGGIVVLNDDGGQITDNSIGGVFAPNGAISFGMLVGSISDPTLDSRFLGVGSVSNARILRNRISGIRSIKGDRLSYPPIGIGVNGGLNGANVIANNMISGIIGDGDTTVAPVGIYVANRLPGSITKLYYNSVSMTGNRVTTNAFIAPSYGVAIIGDDSNADPNVEMKNNIISNNQTVTGPGLNANAFAVGTSSTTFANLDSDYNLYFPSGTNARGFRSGSLLAVGSVLSGSATNYTNVSLWSNAIGDDVNSALIGQRDPLFINPLNNLRIPITSPAVDRGIPVSVLDDFDGTVRSVVGFTNGVPDVGADEIPANSVSATASIRGRLRTSTSRGLANAVVVLTNTITGEVRSARSTSFGFFNFQDLPLGDFYVLSVSSKRFVFNRQTFRLNESLNDLILSANE
jgi:hypothetical protein